MIYAITGDEFDNGNEEYDKASLTWYPKQEILADEDDHRISTECIGGDGMLQSGFEDDVKYVRNNAIDTDYEIVIDDVNTWTEPED